MTAVVFKQHTISRIFMVMWHATSSHLSINNYTGGIKITLDFTSVTTIGVKVIDNSLAADCLRRV